MSSQALFKTNLNQLSLDAYHSVHLSQNRKRIYELLKDHGPMSSREVAESLDWTINRVTGRVLELRILELIEFCGEQVSPDSGRRENVWRVRPGSVID